ncbi:hypothetical protein TWF481_007352 [Arthrobotrys musiformis]|uniref:Uncharacterized protein n=1 Tax=Arthrobotrys musiformis TaxID=47236 RepID=A0AAV9WD38_9PEZI
MTEPLVNIFVSPGLYIAPEDTAGVNVGWEQCGGANRWCYLAPANASFTGVCGTWLGLSDHCCWVATQGDNSYQSCNGIAGITDTPFARFGTSDAFNATGSTCPSGSFSFFEYELVSGNIATCCPNGQTGQAFLIGGNADGTQYSLDSIRCGNFDVPDGPQPSTTAQTSTDGPAATSSPGSEDTMTESTGMVLTRSTAQPPTTTAPPGTVTASATGGQATTTSGSSPKIPSKLSYLIVGSALFGLFFSGNL